jgi:hypothetical protein
MLETIRQFAEEQLIARGDASEVRATHARHFAGREADILALWDSPRQRAAYDWFTIELANLRTAFRWAAVRVDLNIAATIATSAAFLGLRVEIFEPIAWAEELIEPALAVDHSRLPFLYMVASNCHTTGRIEAAVRYSEAGLTVVGSGSDEVPSSLQGLLSAAYCTAASPNGMSSCAAPGSRAVATLTPTPGHPWYSHCRSPGPATRRWPPQTA